MCQSCDRPPPPGSAPLDSRPSSINVSRQSTGEYRSDDLPECEIETNPDMPSPARVRWIDAFTRVCAQLNQVRPSPCQLVIVLYGIT